MLILKVLWKIILILLITAMAGAITCGGNLLLDGTLVFIFGGGSQYGSRYADGLMILWLFELFISFVLAIIYITNKEKYPVFFPRLIKILKIITITIITVFVGILIINMISLFL